MKRAELQIVHLAIRCPRCRSRPRLRVSAEFATFMATAVEAGQIDGEQLTQTYQCAHVMSNGSHCNAIVEIRAKHWRVA